MRYRLNVRATLLNSGLASVLVGAGFFLGLDPSALAQNEVIVVTGTAFNPDTAPAKASLDTTQPETIINQNYIENSVSPTADYVSVLSIVPSLTGMSINGLPGLSDGNVKNTLRGMPDGNFGMSYDNIPFGDTNGPTHHSESYFPGSTIGSVLVDRGPGNAGTLGASTFGGTIKLFSEPLSRDMHGKENMSFGSFNTWNSTTNLQTGDFDIAGVTSRLMVNFQDTGSSGYLTFQSTHHDNELVKFEADIAANWRLTLFANRNFLAQIVNDNNGATAAQVTTYGKSFALQNTNPALPTYAAYNPEKKLTDMDYVRLEGDITDNVHFDDQAYTYSYLNQTVTTTDVTQTLANIIGNTGQKLGTKVAGVSFPNDIQGYTKLNAYRVWGNIARTAVDYNLGGVSGQVRLGLWSEWQSTQRARYYLDISKCAAANNGLCPGFAVEHSGTFADQKTSSGTTFGGVDGVGYLEHTGWTQYQPFVEVDIKPFDGLTLTPGFKYVWWEHTITSGSLVKGKPPTVYGATTPANPDSFVTTRSLPFATINYKIEPSWSVYAQYANGIYIPDITSFEVNTPILSFPKPQTTTNYQFGTVYYADNFTFDADAYYIESDNTIQQKTCDLLTPPGPAADTCNFNAGTVFYRGIEGEMTYAFHNEVFDGALDGFAVFANGSLNSAQAHYDPLHPSPSFQDKSAPFWTAAAGITYRKNGLSLSLTDKVIGQQYQDSPSKRLDIAGGAPLLNSGTTTAPIYAANGAYQNSFYKLGAYNRMDLTGSYDLGQVFGPGVDLELGGSINNLLNARNIVSVTVNDSKPATGNAGGGTTAVASSFKDLVNRPNSLDQYYFMPPTSFQVSLKAKF